MSKINFKKDISIVVADDHPLLLNGLVHELHSHNYTQVHKATNGKNALELILSIEPNIAMLDIHMPELNGFEVIEQARKKGCKTNFIILSFHKQSEYLEKAKSLNINGYLLKEDDFEEIEKCINSIENNVFYLSKSLDTSQNENLPNDLILVEKLTTSEKKILKLVTKQFSNAEISDYLSISIRTVEKHRSNIIQKLELVGGTNSLTNWALTNKNSIDLL